MIEDQPEQFVWMAFRSGLITVRSLERAGLKNAISSDSSRAAATLPHARDRRTLKERRDKGCEGALPYAQPSNFVVADPFRHIDWTNRTPASLIIYPNLV